MKHGIEIEGLPEGWEPVAFRCPKDGESYVGYDGKVIISLSTNDLHGPRLIVKKKQPRRIVLEETDEDNIKHNNSWCSQHFTRGLILTQQPKRWREIKETDLSLHNADDKESLRLSVDECRAIITGNVYAHPIIIEKISKFIKDK